MEQTDSSEWARRDAQYVEARLERDEAGRRWRELGGYIPVGSKTIVGPVIELMELEDANRRYHALSMTAFPPHFEQLAESLRLGDPDAVEPMLRWLEEDHFCRHTGYRKQRVMCFLRRAPLDEAQEDRVRALMLAVVERGHRLEFRDTCRLARRVDSPGFRDALASLAGSTSDGRTEWRARRMLAECEKNDA
jgi:hypothetical protein